LALSYWIDYLGFITEGKLAAVLITPSLGVPNWSVIYIINTAPSTAHDPEKPETADNKKISKLGTIPQIAVHVAARWATQEEERACNPLLFSHFRR
jgi:hypothetical protein